MPSCPQWNPNGITFANETIVGIDPLDIFIDRNNTVYVIDEFNEELHIWSVDSVNPITIILGDGFDPWGLFVTIDGSIYIGSGSSGEVKKWTSNAAEGIVVMDASGACSALFVDIDNYLYCSLGAEHQVIKQSLDGDPDTLIIVAGNRTEGSADNMLNVPRGIYVTITFDLYVADFANHRIQFFKSGQLNGLTVAKSISVLDLNLYYPTGVFLDADDYLFIVDYGNDRIIGSGSNGFYCIVGCLGGYGSTSSYLYYPYALTFDSYGNIFVSDSENNRIQKFILMTNTFSK